MIFGATYFLLWLLVAIQGIVICFLVRQLSELRARAESGLPSAMNRLPLGSVAPEFGAIDLRSGQTIHSSAFHGERVVLLFLSSDCSTCRKLAAGLASAGKDALSGLVLFCHGTQRACQNYLSTLEGIVPILRTEKTNVAGAFRLSGFPVAVIVDEAWRIAGFRYPSHSGQIIDCLSEPVRSAAPSELQSV